MKNYEIARIFRNKILISILLVFIALQLMITASIETNNLKYLYNSDGPDEYSEIYSEYLQDDGDKKGELYEGLENVEDVIGDPEDILGMDFVRELYPDAVKYYEENRDNIDFEKIRAFSSINRDRKSKLDYLSQYHDYIEDIISQAEDKSGFSVFQNSSFSTRNIKKTADDYGKTQNFVLTETNTAAFDNAIANEFSGYFSLIICLIFSVFAFKSRNTETELCIRSCKNGRISLLFKRIRAMALFTALTVILVNISNYLYYGYIYGYDLDWSANVRSSALFANFLYNINFAQAAVVILIFKFEALFLISLITYLIFYSVKNFGMASIATAAFLIVENLLYNLVPIYSPLSFFKVANLFYFLEPTAALKYSNISIFGFPFRAEMVFTVSAFIFIILFSMLNALAVKLSYPIKSKSKLEYRLNSFTVKAENLLNRLKSKIFSKHIETYKFLFSQKMIVVFIIFAIILANGYSFGEYGRSAVNGYLNTFYNDYGGKLNDKALKSIEKTESMLSAAQEERDSYYNDYLQEKISEDEYYLKISYLPEYNTEEKAIGILRSQIDYINEELSNGFEAYLIPQDDYNTLCGVESLDYENSFSLYLIIIALLFTYGITASDKNKNILTILHSCKYGRKRLFYKKASLLAASTVLVYAFCVVFRLLYYRNYIHLKYLSAPLQSLETFAQFPIKISILNYYIIINLVRLVMLLAVEFVMLYICVRLSAQTALITNTCIFAVPSVFMIMGADFAADYSVIKYLNFLNGYLESGTRSINIYWIELAAAAAIMFIFIWLARKKFTVTGRK